MNTGDVFQGIAAVATSAAAIAAAASARASRAAVERANLAFVWPVYSVEGPDQNLSTHRLRVRLHSAGPGIAFDVRWSVLFPDVGRRAWRQAEKDAARGASDAVRSLRPGESAPKGTPPYEVVVNEHPFDQAWFLVVRWSDSAGRRWEFIENDRRDVAHKPVKLRRQRSGRWLMRGDWAARRADW